MKFSASAAKKEEKREVNNKIYTQNNNFEALFAKYSSNINGLTDKMVEENAKFGKNELKEHKKDSFFKKFLLQFKNLMVIVLLISAIISTIISLATQEYDQLFEGALIFVIVIANALIGVVQEQKAEVALGLLAQEASPKSRVLRNGAVVTIPSSEVVVGDIVMLKSGEFVPADIVLLESTNLKINESSLTGESAAAYKDAKANVAPNTPLAERSNMAFSGTSVTYGSGKGLVVAVGKNTEMGKIAGLLTQKSPKTPLEKNIEKIGKVITYGVLIIVAIVFFTQIIFNHSIDFLQAFLTAVALAVAAIPESLPAVITIIMALGVERLAKHGAIVKTLSSVETLGSCNVLCTDKTGTLTQNNMQVKTIYVSGKLQKDNFSGAELDKFLQAIVCCNNSSFSADGKLSGDATETSLMDFACKVKPNILGNLPRRIHEIPFDSTRKIMSTVHSSSSGTVQYSKGAFDYIISRCSLVEIDGKIMPLDAGIKLKLTRAHSSMASGAQRVIAVAYKKANNSADYTEDNLIFLGLAGIIDPPRKEVYGAIDKCFSAGLKPIMITGDHPETAFAIAKELKIAKNISEVITGADLDTIPDKELPKVIKNYTVFARVSPEHKTKIVRALKKSGNIVGFTGDGINDAPSIKHADIGVCMGSGTDVTKSVSDLIVSTDDFATIVIAVEEGRTIYSNIQKTLLFLLSTNMVEVLGIFVSAIVLPNATFLLPSQILFINLVTDSLPAFALGIEKPEKDVMKKPPRATNSTIFSGIGWHILWQGFAQTFVVMIMFVCALNTCGNVVASTMVFITICLMQIIHAVNCKSTRSLVHINVFDNKTFNISFIALLALILFVALVPPMQTMFGLASLSIKEWLIITLVSVSIIPVVEICKFFINHSFSHRRHSIAIKMKLKHAKNI